MLLPRGHPSGPPFSSLPRRPPFVRPSRRLYPLYNGAARVVFGPALLPERRRTVPRTDFPIILFGSVYWGGLLDWVRSAMIVEGKASEADLGLLSVTDSPTEARDLILAATKQQYGGAGYERQAREATRDALGKGPAGPEG